MDFNCRNQCRRPWLAGINDVLKGEECLMSAHNPLYSGLRYSLPGQPLLGRKPRKARSGPRKSKNS